MLGRGDIKQSAVFFYNFLRHSKADSRSPCRMATFIKLLLYLVELVLWNSAARIADAYDYKSV